MKYQASRITVAVTQIAASIFVAVLLAACTAAPGGKSTNLAIFYRDFGYSTELVLLGKIDGGTDLLNVPGSVKVTIERVE